MPSDPRYQPSRDLGAESRRFESCRPDRLESLESFAGSGAPSSLNEIERLGAGISQKMLTQTLRGLERDGLVSRTVYPEIPPRVVYEVNAAGGTLLSPLAALQKWADEHIGGVLKARQKYDEK